MSTSNTNRVAENSRATASPPPKRQKPSPDTAVPVAKVKDHAYESLSTLPAGLAGADISKIQRAKQFAVKQAQQERWLACYRTFDSPYGNFIVPVVPSRDDLLD